MPDVEDESRSRGVVSTATVGRGGAGCVDGERGTRGGVGAWWVAVIGLCALPAVCVLAVCIGAVTVAPGVVFQVLRDHVVPGSAPVSPEVIDGQIIWTYRVPRTMAAVLVGAALAMSGAVLQVVVGNPLAEPGVLGVSAGATLAAVVTMTTVTTMGASVSTPVAGFLGSMVTLLLVIVLSRGHGGFTGGRIVLAGVGVGQVALAATTFVQLQAHPTEVKGILFWMMGSVAGTESVGDLVIPAVGVAGAGCVAVVHGRHLNALAFGDEDAISLGISPSRLRLVMIVVVSVLTGVSVALAGGVAFVGLFVPHLVRFVVGPDNRWVVPLSALWGGVVLVLIDICSRSLFDGQEFPLTVFTGAVGAPFFLWILHRHRSGGVL